jgi:hypothetical protein
MKIIRHSHKTIVYSLSLLLYAQQTSCMQQSVLKVDTRPQLDITQKIKALSGPNARIDAMQKMLGSVIKSNELQEPSQSQNADIFDAILINNLTLEQTQQKLIDLHKLTLNENAQRFRLIKSRDQRKRERDIETLIPVVAGFVLKKQMFEANLNVITGGGRQNLPEDPNDLDAKDTIMALQLTLGDNSTATFLGKSIEQHKQALQKTHDRLLQIEDTCCCTTPAQDDEVLNIKIDLRALATPLVCFAQKQEILSQLRATAAASQSAPAVAVAPPQQPQFHGGQPLYGTLHPQHSSPPTYIEKPHSLSKVADPFIPGSGVGSINNDDLTK